jgi:hypothetical protein
MPLMLDLIAYLTDECCGGQPGQCVDLPAKSKRTVTARQPRSATKLKATR